MPPRRRSSRMNMERVHLLKEQVYSFLVLYWSKYLTLNLHFHSHGILQEFFSDLLQPEGAIEARRREIKKAKGSKAQNKDVQFFLNQFMITKLICDIRSSSKAFPESVVELKPPLIE